MSGLRAFLLLDAAWLASFLYLATTGRPVSDPLFLLVILGLALPGLALLVYRGVEEPEPEPADRPQAGEGWLLGGLLLFVTLFLAFKAPLLALWVPESADPRGHEIANTLVKLVVFVALPLAAYQLRSHLSPAALGLRWPPASAGGRGRAWLAFLVIGGALVGIQLLLGRAARPLFDGSLAHRHWIAGLVLCFLWMSLEAGLVEEVFFRLILQSRLAALTRSPAAGLFLSALLFGLAHAPGLWLRGAGAMEGISTAPSLALSIAYSVTTMGVAGLVFGVLWMRTRNWLLLVALHGLTDALSNTAGFMETWGL